MNIHELKIDTIQHDNLESGKQKHLPVHTENIYKEGEVLYLREFNQLINEYTERSLMMKITHVCLGPNLLKDYVIVSVRIMK